MERSDAEGELEWAKDYETEPQMSGMVRDLGQIFRIAEVRIGTTVVARQSRPVPRH